MGNIIRLGIARIGLALNTVWSATRTKSGRKPPVVLLVLGAEAVGKTTIASRISKNGKYEAIEYYPTMGFSILEFKDRGTPIKLFDVGGSQSVRELWRHYYPDAHGFIFVVDGTEQNCSLENQRQILELVLEDDRVKRKPLLIIGNKLDIDRFSVKDIVSKMDLIQLANSAKSVTRLDLTSRDKVEGVNDGLMTGFRWIVSYIKYHWEELSERVEHDSFEEQSIEKAKFESNHQSKFLANHISPLPSTKSVKSSSAKSNTRSKSSTSRIHPVPVEIVPIHQQNRVDPEAGSDKEWKPDATHQIILQPDTEDEYPEIVLVESRAEVHEQRSRSESTVTTTSSVREIETVLGKLDSSHRNEGWTDGTMPVDLISPSNGIPPTRRSVGTVNRPKLFRNKTVPTDEPIRKVITENLIEKPHVSTANSIFEA